MRTRGQDHRTTVGPGHAFLRPAAAAEDRREVTAALLEALGRLVRTSRAASHRQTTEFGLTGTPLGLLTTLAEGDARPGDLAVRLQIAPSVVSRAVVPLEQGGLVERRPDPADARASRLGLTEAGHRRLREARQEFVDRFAPLLDDWESTDIATLTSLMGRLESTVGRHLDGGHDASHGAAGRAADPDRPTIA